MNTKKGYIQRLEKEFAQDYAAMNWVAPYAALQAEQERERLISAIFRRQGAQWRFSNTKLVTHDLSPGCALCGAGDWSCLFINNICNARCFYCPASQEDLSLPATGRVEFSTPKDYVDYVAAFDVKGVSFSGGEPFMSFDRVTSFLSALRSGISPPLYVWMYTNGILATEDKLKALADGGLGEIRFDLSANHYKLTALEKAVGIIPRVTVEIPAIPEDLHITKPLLKQLESAGVNFLNLHQIRVTKFNRPKLAQRDYTFVHGPAATVLETELAALELIRHGLENGIALPVNYCAFTFRNQFQRAGAQKRNADRIKEGYEGITSTGQIRTLSLQGDPSHLARICEQLTVHAHDTRLWKLAPKGDWLFLHDSLIPGLPTKGLNLKVDHSGTSLAQSVSYRHRFRKIPLNPGKPVVVERFLRHPAVVLPEDRIQGFIARYLNAPVQAPSNAPPLPDHICHALDPFEFFSPGLAPYF